MRLVPARRPPITGAAKSAKTTPIVTAAAASGTTSKRRPLDPSNQTLLAFATWLAMSGSGSRTATTLTTVGRLRMALHGPVAIATTGSSAAVPGSTILSTSAPPPAAGSPPLTGTTIWASGWGGRLSLESLALYLWGPGGEALVGSAWSTSDLGPQSTELRIRVSPKLDLWIRAKTNTP
jgi:hypothetical protein